MAKYFGMDISELHCNYCSCPKELWKPMDSYPSDRSCELYEDMDVEADALNEDYGYVDYNRLYSNCEKYIKEYPDLPDLGAAVNEVLGVYEDLGIYKVKRLHAV